MVSYEQGKGEDFYRGDAAITELVDEGVRIGEQIDESVLTGETLYVSRHGKLVGFFVPVDLQRVVAESETEPVSAVNVDPVNLLLDRMAETPRRQLRSGGGTPEL